MHVFSLRPHIETALREDLGLAGDLTSQTLFAPSDMMEVVFRARKPGILAGRDFIRETYEMLDGKVSIQYLKQDGDRLAENDLIASVQGPCRTILSGERVILNYMCHLSGIASATRQFVDRISHTRTQLVCTRKTTPGLRDLEKYAVRCGGGVNHRFGLFDAVMLKDNHIAAAGSIAQAVHRVRQQLGHMVKIEVEIDHLHQLSQALQAKADVIMLDNMSLSDMAKAVEDVQGQAILEASGNVTLDRVADIADTGVDVISTGWITHSAPILDIGLDIM